MNKSSHCGKVRLWSHKGKGLGTGIFNHKSPVLKCPESRYPPHQLLFPPGLCKARKPLHVKVRLPAFPEQFPSSTVPCSGGHASKPPRCPSLLWLSRALPPLSACLSAKGASRTASPFADSRKTFGSTQWLPDLTELFQRRWHSQLVPLLERSKAKPKGINQKVMRPLISKLESSCSELLILKAKSQWGCLVCPKDYSHSWDLLEKNTLIPPKTHSPRPWIPFCYIIKGTVLDQTFF